MGGNHFIATNFDTPQRLRNCLFTMKFLAQHGLYDKKKSRQISRPKDLPKQSYLKSSNIGSCCGKFFTAANFDSLSKIEYFLFHEIFGTKTSLCS
jgi:hypothetical protein